jgi:mRNA-degrading endonuclease YafQ of YafQ-DinJ toxin-antitoxin module
MEKPLKKIFEKSKERINTLKSLMQKLSNEEALEVENQDLELVDKSPSKEITVNVSWQSVAKSTIAVLVLLALANFVLKS